MGKVYLVCSTAQGMQVLQTFEQAEAEKLLADQNFQINDLIQAKRFQDLIVLDYTQLEYFTSTFS